MRTIEEYAKRGEQHDVVDALKLLTQAYMDMCGISYGCRTVVFWAAEVWQKKLAWLDLPLSEAARKNGLARFMPYVCDEYDPDIYDKYDIAAMDYEDCLVSLQSIVKDQDFDEPTTEVLCWGLLQSQIEKEEKYPKIEAIAQDGTLIKGFIMGQHCGSTSVVMESPYDIMVYKEELVRDARELLVEAYKDCLWLRKMEKEARALYPKYQEELAKCKDDKYDLPKIRVFDEVYHSITSKSVVMSIDELFHEWFGLEFYVPRYKRESNEEAND